MTDLRVGRKSLYLYSHDDPLCSAERVDALVAARRAAGADVAALSWRRSQHVGHLIKNYREYTEALLGFLQGLA